MLEFIAPVFEMFPIELLAAPAAFIKAEGYRGDDAPRKPTRAEIIAEIKKKKRENAGKPIDINRWEDALDVLANGPIEYLILVQNDIIPPESTEAVLTGYMAGDSGRMKAANNRVKILERLENLSAHSIPSRAQRLTHDVENNNESIGEWGLEIENAVGRFLNAKASVLRQKSFHQSQALEKPKDQLKLTLETASVSKFRKAFINMRWNLLDAIQQNSQLYLSLRLKIMPFDERMTLALETVGTMEEACKADIQSGKERINAYTETQDMIQIFHGLLESFRDSLVQERKRLIQDEARDFQESGNSNDSLRAKFQDMSCTMKNDIANRLQQLNTTLHMCEVEFGLYEEMKKNERQLSKSLDHLKRSRFPLFRQQLLQAQNIKLGHEIVRTDNLSADLQKISGQKQRDRVAREIVDDVSRELMEISDELGGFETQEILLLSKAEQPLLIEYKPEPPMIEYQEPQTAKMDRS